MGIEYVNTFFIKTLDVSNKRLDTVIMKKKNDRSSGVAPKDMRGNKKPGNKIVTETVDHVIEHIKLYPNYTSHYTRSKNPKHKVSGFQTNTDQDVSTLLRILQREKLPQCKRKLLPTYF